MELIAYRIRFLTTKLYIYTFTQQETLVATLIMELMLTHTISRCEGDSIKAILFTIFQLEVPVILRHLPDNGEQEDADRCKNGVPPEILYMLLYSLFIFYPLVVIENYTRYFVIDIQIYLNQIFIKIS